MYLIRLDDASEYMDINKWDRIERLLKQYNIRPIVGIIPNNQDIRFIDKYDKDTMFYSRVKEWMNHKWEIALHGYCHVFISDNGGLNPINNRSEFAGLSLENQEDKIAKGIKILNENGINPKVFFAPAHTFDENTIEALRNKSDIRIISDTIANNIYKKKGFYFIPQQSGRVRKLPFKITTFCYHPNDLTEKDFHNLEMFIKNNKHKFGSFMDIDFIDRERGIYDKLLSMLYFNLRKLFKR